VSCPVTGNPYKHFLLHSQRIGSDKWPNTSMEFYHVAISMSFLTPAIEREGKGAQVLIEKFLATICAMKRTINRDRNLLHGLYDEGMFVAPTAWPKGVGEAFGLQEPPTPYEVACAVLVAPTNFFWAFRRKGHHIDPCDYSVFMWWLMGFPVGRMTTHLGRSEGVLWCQLARTVEAMMKRRRFAVWACGIDVRPYCTDRIAMEVARRFYMGEAIPSDTIAQMRRYQNRGEKLFAHPFIESQLKSGVRHGQCIRPLYRPEIVWLTKEEKLRWESREGRSQDAIRKIRKEIARENRLSVTKAHAL